MYKSRTQSLSPQMLYEPGKFQAPIHPWLGKGRIAKKKKFHQILLKDTGYYLFTFGPCNIGCHVSNKFCLLRMDFYYC